MGIVWKTKFQTSKIQEIKPIQSKFTVVLTRDSKVLVSVCGRGQKRSGEESASLRPEQRVGSCLDVATRLKSGTGASSGAERGDAAGDAPSKCSPAAALGGRVLMIQRFRAAQGGSLSALPLNTIITVTLLR